jgi:hypothetical protein
VAETALNHPSPMTISRGNGSHTNSHTKHSTSMANRHRSASASTSNHQGYPVPTVQLRAVNTPSTTTNNKAPLGVRFAEGGLEHECRHHPVSQRSAPGNRANVTNQKQANFPEPQTGPRGVSQSSSHPGRMGKPVPVPVPVPGAWPMSPTSAV